MILRVLGALTALVLVVNGLRMLFEPEGWYQSIPSVPHTGPFNVHFVRDIGCAYLAAALGAALAVWRQPWCVPAGVVALTFLGLHAGVHLWEAATGHASAAYAGVIDTVGVYAPPVVLLLLIVFAFRQNSAEGGLR